MLFVAAHPHVGRAATFRKIIQVSLRKVYLLSVWILLLSRGVEIDENTHYAIDIYDNAMLVIALNNFIELTDDAAKKAHWTAACDTLKRNIRQHLWDAERHKFIPHIYLKDSPFPAKFDENKIYYHGGTAVAIQAGLLSEEEIREANQRMLENVKRAHAQTIGLTLYPTYPAGSFKNVGMHPYGYQNGGDWTWFGARMIHALTENGMIAEAYEELQPMLERVVENNGFSFTMKGRIRRLIHHSKFIILFTYSYEPRKRSERLFSVLREKVTYCDIFSARQGVLTRTE